MGSIKIELTPKTPNIPKFEDKTKVDVRYMVIAPFVSVHIYWDSNNSRLTYEVEEPILSERNIGELKKIELAMKESININFTANDPQSTSLIDYIEKNARMITNDLGMTIPEDEFQKIFYYLYRDFIGLNEIEPIMKDYFIEDVECNGTGDPVYVVHRLFRNMKTNVKFNSIDSLANFVEKLAQKAGRYISYASPILDGSLPDGSRVNATYTKDITSKGPTFTIRKFTKVPWTPTQIMGFGSISPEMLAYFWILLQYQSNILIAGGTSSGKTTLLNALAFFIPQENRVVSIEDTRELQLPRENWLPSVVRGGISAAGTGDIDMFSLLKGSFRQNPDYVIVGEVRGKEAAVLFQGMASGHASISTMHADSVATLVQRLETPPISLSPTLINSLDAVAIQTHAIVNGQETRRLREVSEIINITPDGVSTINTPFKWNPGDDKFYSQQKSIVLDKISIRFGIPKERLLEELSVRTKLLYAMYQRRVLSYNDVQKVINEYNQNPESVLKQFDITR
jgi:flagellar protein FlaI